MSLLGAIGTLPYAAPELLEELAWWVDDELVTAKRGGPTPL